jgi:hypothetical protein
VEAAGDLVAVAAELAPRVQHREDDLDGALTLVRPRRVRIDRDAPPVVLDAAPTVGQERDVDAGCIAGHGFVDGVVDDLPHEVVQPGQARGTDVHSGPLADRFEAFQDLDVLGAVVGLQLGQDARSRGVRMRR